MKTDQKTSKAVCRFENIKEPLTVGDVFEMHCEWPLHLAFLSPPVRIEFPKQALSTPHDEKDKILKKALPHHPIQKETKSSPYSLTILNTKNVLPGKAVFKVTSYQPGDYDTGFHILSDKGGVEVQPLTWKVKSVLPAGKTVSPYPPYGPWMEPLPFWYWPAGALLLISLLVFAVFKVRAFMKRKKKIKAVQKRMLSVSAPSPLTANKQDFQPSVLSAPSPARSAKMSEHVATPTNQSEKHPSWPAYYHFISQLNLLDRGRHKQKEPEHISPMNAITKLGKIFCLFLENKFFIYAVGEKPEIIIKQLKKYYPLICEIHKKSLLDFFSELKRLSAIQTQAEDREQLIRMARQIADSLHENETSI